MAWPTSLQMALKEWAVVCRALETGRQMVLLRKGGIYEKEGEFQLEQSEFLLFPTYVHQNFHMLKSTDHEGVAPVTTEPGAITLGGAGVVSDIIQLKSREQINAIDDEHVWTKPLIDMRFNYRPTNPLFLMIVRAYRLHTPVTIANTPAYEGCKSWVPLEQPVSVVDALPVLDDAKYEARRMSILDRVQ